MKNIISTRAAQTALTVVIILGVLTPFVGQLWPVMLALWIGWAILTPVSIRTEVRRAH